MLSDMTLAQLLADAANRAKAAVLNELGHKIAATPEGQQGIVEEVSVRVQPYVAPALAVLAVYGLILLSGRRR